MPDDVEVRRTLSEPAARQLANATKTRAQWSGITPRWLVSFLPWVPVEAGIYRLNRVKEGEVIPEALDEEGAYRFLLADPILVRRPLRPAEPAASGWEPLEVEVLRHSSTGYVVLDAGGRPLLSNDRASELGVLRAGIVDQRIAAAAGRAAVSREPRIPPAVPRTIVSGCDEQADAGAIWATAPPALG